MHLSHKIPFMRITLLINKVRKRKTRKRVEVKIKIIMVLEGIMLLQASQVRVNHRNQQNLLRNNPLKHPKRKVRLQEVTKKRTLRAAGTKAKTRMKKAMRTTRRERKTPLLPNLNPLYHIQVRAKKMVLMIMTMMPIT
jgi:hypothetical protein